LYFATIPKAMAVAPVIHPRHRYISGIEIIPIPMHIWHKDWYWVLELPYYPRSKKGSTATSACGGKIFIKKITLRTSFHL